MKIPQTPYIMVSWLELQPHVGMTQGQYAARTVAVVSQVTCPSAVYRASLATSRLYGGRIIKWSIGGMPRGPRQIQHRLPWYPSGIYGGQSSSFAGLSPSSVVVIPSLCPFLIGL